MEREEDVARMLADIRSEVHYTRGYIQRDAFSPQVMEAMATVPRHAFVPEDYQEYAYDNGPLSIGHGQTISQPYIVALMSELLEVGKGDTVLEIGTGSGYQTAVLSLLVNQVYSVEVVEPLGLLAKTRLSQLGYHNIETTIADGYLGWQEHAPYDGIIVTAAAAHVPPPLEEQLKPGARLVIPVSDGFMGQQLLVVKKGEDGVIQREPVLPVAFVPLVRK
ncbi:MAG: protein-L-isoaspartate(D-aspartate) O-methyltransferase [Pseudomonadota bacterium]